MRKEKESSRKKIAANLRDELQKRKMNDALQ